jgi:hypothetical protein
LQAGTQLLLRLGQGRKRVDGEQQGAGFLLGHVEYLYLDFHVRVEVATQVTTNSAKVFLDAVFAGLV